MKFFKKQFFIILSFALIVGLLELVSFVFYSIQEGGFFSPRKKLQEMSSFWDKMSGCNFVSYIQPDVHLGYRRRIEKKCKTEANKFGFSGNKQSISKEKGFYNILVLGGSVADLLASTRNQIAQYIFQEYLNENFISPTGKPFKIINGALGGYKQPHQVIVSMEMAELSDAIITLEGFNENQVIHEHKLNSPPYTFYQMNSYFYPKPINYHLNYFLYDVQNYIKTNFSFSYLGLFTFNSIKKLYSPHGGPRYHQAYQKYDLGLKDKNKIIDFNISQYVKYLKQINAIAKLNNVSFLVFFQPIPGLFKTLSEKEKEITRNPEYAPRYKYIVEQVSKRITNENIINYSLLDILKDKKGSYYVDHIHFSWQYPLPEGIQDGQNLLAESIGNHIAKKLFFKTKRR